MLPENILSSEVIDAPFLYPRNVTRLPKVDYDYGGRALNDPSAGLQDRVWRADYLAGQVVLSASGNPATPVLTIANLEELGFTFDQNMNPFVCYQLESGACAFYWFDSQAAGYVTTALPPGSRSPRCVLDDKRRLSLGSSDIILAYCRGSSLYMRVQRERYLIEHELANDIGQRTLIQVGISIRLRFQFHLSTS